MEKETIIYGGTFNPPTNCHREVISNCLELFPDSEVWVMPSGRRTDKPEMLDDDVRVTMLQIMVSSCFTDKTNISVSRFEIDNLPLPTSTFLTFMTLKEVFPERNFSFVFGADSLADMPNWGNGDFLRTNMNILAVPRGGIYIDPTPNIRLMPPIPLTEFSSTDVRQSVADGLGAEGFVCPAVAEYILANNLYLDAKV